MALLAGTSIGPYEVVSLLGAGGMGEVYRARDPRLSRDIALKIVPEYFALDSDRLDRFRREAQVLAARSIAVPTSGRSGSSSTTCSVAGGIGQGRRVPGFPNARDPDLYSRANRESASPK